MIESLDKLSGSFSDNYFDLLPGEEKVVMFKGALEAEMALKGLRIKFLIKIDKQPQGNIFIL